MSRRVAVVGGGPGGLFLATLLRRARPGCRRDALRAQPEHGRVRLRRRLLGCDPAQDRRGGPGAARRARLPTVATGTASTCGARASDTASPATGWPRSTAACSSSCFRRTLPARGSTCGSGRYAPPVDELSRDFDVVVGADGTNSVVREHLGEVGHTVDTATAKFIWFGTTHLFDGLTFVHRASEHGNFAVHGYPISDDLSTFIVETDESTWRAAGLDAFDVSQPPGASDTTSPGLPREALRRGHRRSLARREQLPLGQLPHEPHPALVPRQRRDARRCRPHRSLLRRLRHQDGHGGRRHSRGADHGCMAR